MTAHDPAVDLFTSAQSRAIDQRAIGELGIPGFELMTRAAAAAFAMLRRRWPAARRLRIVCGGGNNGGDGYLVAHGNAGNGYQKLFIEIFGAGYFDGGDGVFFRNPRRGKLK